MTVAIFPLTAGGVAIAASDAAAIIGAYQGKPMVAGGLVATENAAAVSSCQGGIPITATGRVAYSTGLPVRGVNGLPMTADGRLSFGPGPMVYGHQELPFNIVGQLVSGVAFSPASLFASGEQGAWYDPSDLSSMFQDAAGTIPVTATNQPVGLIRDKSGRNNHATQATAANRPMYFESGALRYLAFNGSTQFLQSSSINLTATDKLTLWAGILKSSDGGVGVVCEFSASIANNGSFGIMAPQNVGTPNYAIRARGTVALADALIAGVPAPNTSVLSGAVNIAGSPQVSTRLNGVTSTTASGSTAGNFSNSPLYIGMRAGTSFPLTGRIYGLVVRGVTSTAQQISDTEKWLGVKAGIVI